MASNAVAPFDLNRFDPATTPPSWLAKLLMANRRWYPTCTTLPSGKVLISYGYSDTLTGAPKSVYDHEVYAGGTGTTVLTQLDPKYDFKVYPYVFVLPDGHVLYAGPKYETGVPGNTPPRKLLINDPSTPSTWQWEGGGGRDFSPGMTNNEGGSVAMFDAVRGRILTAGGVSLGAPYTTHRLSAVYRHDIDGQWLGLPSMFYRRKNHNLVCLPDESVLAVGGNLLGEHAMSGEPDPQPVMEAEIFKPWLGANGQWERTFTVMTDPRYYHSIAILLRDARVLVAGGETDSPDLPYEPTYSYTENSAQVFKPPYLDNVLNRPNIAASPTTLSYGQQFTITLTNAFLIGKVTMTRLGAVTHGFDQDQRCVKLTHSGGGSSPTTTITATAPANANIAPPGDYFLWVLSNTGVPCELAAIVKIG